MTARSESQIFGLSTVQVGLFSPTVKHNYFIDELISLAFLILIWLIYGPLFFAVILIPTSALPILFVKHNCALTATSRTIINARAKPHQQLNAWFALCVYSTQQEQGTFLIAIFVNNRAIKTVARLFNYGLKPLKFAAAVYE